MQNDLHLVQLSDTDRLAASAWLISMTTTLPTAKLDTPHMASKHHESAQCIQPTLNWHLGLTECALVSVNARGQLAAGQIGTEKKPRRLSSPIKADHAQAEAGGLCLAANRHMPICFQHIRVGHSERGPYNALCNHHATPYGRSGVSSQTAGNGPLHAPSALLYLTCASHKAAGNTPLLSSANGRLGTTKHARAINPSVNNNPRSHDMSPHCHSRTSSS